MKTVISASRRTDIPAFYLKWFMESIQKGFVEVANPFFPKNIRRVSLLPQDVAWIVFWSRNYGPFLKHTSFFEPYELFFHFTILPASKLEKIPVKITPALAQLQQLANLYDPQRIIWRYDPLVYWREGNSLISNHHIRDFKFLCKEIGEMGVKSCYTSFAFPYAKFLARFKKKFPQDTLYEPTLNEQLSIINEMQAIASIYGIKLFSCCNDRLLRVHGVEKGHCIDGSLLNRLVPHKKVSRAKAPTRKDCGCTKSIDIGDYRRQPCPFGCLYCYANPQWQ